MWHPTPILGISASNTKLTSLGLANSVLPRLLRGSLQSSRIPAVLRRPRGLESASPFHDSTSSQTSAATDIVRCCCNSGTGIRLRRLDPVTGPTHFFPTTSLPRSSTLSLSYSTFSLPHFSRPNPVRSNFCSASGPHHHVKRTEPREAVGSGFSRARIAPQASMTEMAASAPDSSAGGTPKASLSRRIESTDEPIIYQMARIIEGSKDVLSLGQGVVHWLPPPSALEAAEAAVRNPKCSGYGIDDGIPELRSILVEKIRKENGLLNSSIMVTAGANQAFVNVVMAVCDPGDTVVLFQPYYFNHLMAFQMSGITRVLHGRRDPTTMRPDIMWVKQALQGKHGAVPKVIVVTNPDNPTGTYVPGDDLVAISKLCADAGCWLILDNTYEYFMYGGRQHVCLEAPHVINIFSFSKAYGMMGWRVGYIAYPDECTGLGGALVKAQDTIPICANLVGQYAAVAAATEGKEWVLERVKQLSINLELAKEALSPLGKDAVKGGEGAIYLWARLPPQFQDDRAVVQWLVKRHGVIVIPGSASGAPGHFRISFANLPHEKYKAAADRLKAGLSELIEKGLVE